MKECFRIKHNSPSCVVIADDLTGALDTGIQFAESGARTVVIAQGSSKPLSHYLSAGYEVISIDSSTRHSSEDEAARIVGEIARECVEAGVPYLYKKTDSVLRGNISAELQAFMKASGSCTLPFVPAFPDLGRKLENGLLYINGQLLLDTELGCDPFDKVESNRVADLFSGSDCKVVDSVQAGYVPGRDSSGSIVIYDSSDNADLEKIEEDLIGAGFTAFAGCAGFAGVLSKAFGFHRQQQASCRVTLPLLFLCGSVNEISKRQLSYLERKGVGRLRLPEALLADECFPCGSDGDRLIGKIADGLYTGGAFIVDTAADSGLKLVAPERTGDKVSASLGALAVNLIGKVPGLSLFVIGGDTLLSFLKKAGCSEIEPIAEIEKGIVLSVISMDGNSVSVISKSGGFGEDDILSKILCEYRKQEVII